MELNEDYKWSDVGVIPKDWEQVSLKQISLQITDGDHVTPQRARDGYYLLSARNVRDGFVDLRDVDHVGASEFKRMKARCAPQTGDLLISCSGHGLGRVSTVPEGLQCVLVRSAALVRIDQKKANSLFIQYWLQGANAQKQISDSLSRAAQPNLFLNSIERLCSPLPPTITEQGAIAEVLNDMDGLLSRLDSLIAKKHDFKEATMQQLLTGQMRFPRFHSEWVIKRLGEVAHIKTGSRNNEDKVGDGQYPFFVRSEIVERINSYSYDCEAILVPGEGKIGSIFHYTNGRFDVHQRVYAITNFVGDISPRFVHLYMVKNFGEWAMKNTVKATVDSLRLPTFQTFEMRMPATLEEQTAIVEVLTDMEAEIAALERRREKTRALKQGMMQELLTGKTRLI